MRKLFLVSTMLLALIFGSGAYASATEHKGVFVSPEEQITLAYKAAKADATFDNGHWVSKKRTVRDLARAIEQTEPTLYVKVARSVPDALAQNKNNALSIVYLLKITTAKTLRMVTFDSLYSYKLVADDQGFQVTHHEQEGLLDEQMSFRLYDAFSTAQLNVIIPNGGRWVGEQSLHELAEIVEEYSDNFFYGAYKTAVADDVNDALSRKPDRVYFLRTTTPRVLKLLSFNSEGQAMLLTSVADSQNYQLRVLVP